MDGSLALRSFAFWAFWYRRTWRGSVLSSVLTPTLFLAAMGVGLGSLVNQRTSAATAQLGGVSYLHFLAPGLLAAAAVQTAAGESTYPVMGAIKWVRNYLAMLATPLGVLDVLFGHVLWIAVRVGMSAAIYLAVMACFGAAASPWALLTIPAGLLVGMAVCTPIVAFAATRENDAGFAALLRFGITPMFLFSGTFFPVSQLPDVLRWVAYATPLWHGVDLSRQCALGRAHAGSVLLHVGYLLVWFGVGLALSARCFRRRLVT